MRNSKKVLSLVLAFAMVLSSMTISFAAEAKTTATQKEADALYDLGLFKGTSATDKVLNLEGKLTREQAMQLMAGIFGWELEGTSEFTDVAAWAQPAVAAAVKEGITNGIDNGKFGGQDQATGIQVVTWFLRALGYDQKEAYTKAAELGMEAGIVTLQDALTLKDAALRGNLTKVAYNTLLATPVGEDTTVIAKLVEAGTVKEAKATELGLVKEVVAADLAVELQEVDNLKEITLVFNKAVDKDSAEDEDNYDLDNSADVKEVELADDQVTVTLTVEDKLDNQEDYKLTVEDVKDLNEVEMKKQEIEFKSFDGELPKVIGIKFNGPKAFELKMSEPIDLKETKKSDKKDIVVKKGNQKLSVNMSELDVDGDTVKVKLNTKLKDGVDYTFDVTGIKDYAGYANFAYEEVVTYNKVNDIPVATVVKADQKVVKIEFSNPVKGLTPAHFYHTFSAWTALAISTDEDFVANKSGETPKTADKTNIKALINEEIDTIYVKFAEDKIDDKNKDNYPLQAGSVEIHVEAEADKETIKDAWDNEFKDQTIVTEVVADKTLPEVKSVEVTAKNEVEIKFTEDMNAKELADKGNYTFYDKDGKKIAGAIKGSIEVDSDKATLTTKDFEGETVTIVIEDLKDDSINENKIEKYTIELTFEDKDVDGVNRVEFKLASDDKDEDEGLLYVVFKENMNDTAVDIKNFQLFNGKEYTELDGDISFFEGSKIVEIELSKKETEEVNKGRNKDVFATKLVVGRVEDAEGNVIDSIASVENIIVPEAAKIFTDGKHNTDREDMVQLVELDKITLQIDQELDQIEAEDFQVSVNNDAKELTTEQKDALTTDEKTALAKDYIAIGGIDYENNKDGCLITITLKDEVKDAGANGLFIKTVANKAGVMAAGTKNSFGTSIGAIVNEPVYDKLVASVEDDNISVDANMKKFAGKEAKTDYKFVIQDEATVITTNQVLVFFNENMDTESVSKNSVEIVNRTVKSAVVDGRKLTITLKAIADDDDDYALADYGDTKPENIEATKVKRNTAVIDALKDQSVTIHRINDKHDNVNTEDLVLEIDTPDEVKIVK